MASKENDNNQTVGDLFRTMREKKKKTLSDVSKELCIQQVYLRALEENDIVNLPEEAYVLGYVRSYAKYLELEEEEILRNFKAEKKDKLLHKDLVFLEPYEGTKLPPKRLALIFSTIAILLIAGFGVFSYWEEMEKTNLEIEAFLESDIENSKEETPSIPEKKPTEPPLDTTISTETDKKLNDSIAEPVVSAESEKTEKDDTKLVPSESVPEQDSAITVSDGIVIIAKQDSWVQVETFDGSIIISKILREGEVYNVPELQNIYMDTGNAGGLEVVINGNNIGAIGDSGQVKRRLPLNEDGLRNVVKNYKLYGVVE